MSTSLQLQLTTVNVIIKMQNTNVDFWQDILTSVQLSLHTRTPITVSEISSSLPSIQFTVMLLRRRIATTVAATGVWRRGSTTAPCKRTAVTGWTDYHTRRRGRDHVTDDGWGRRSGISSCLVGSSPPTRSPRFISRLRSVRNRCHLPPILTAAKPSVDSNVRTKIRKRFQEPHSSWTVALHSGGTSVFRRRTFPVLRSTYSWWVTTYVGKPSAKSPLTRPTQPIILSGSINK